MNNQKRNTPPTLNGADRGLIAGGFVATTLLGLYLAYVLFSGYLPALLIEAAVYAVVLAIYILTLRKPDSSRVLLSRVISYAGIIAAVLTALFVVYFLVAFRW